MASGDPWVLGLVGQDAPSAVIHSESTAAA